MLVLNYDYTRGDECHGPAAANSFGPGSLGNDRFNTVPDPLHPSSSSSLTHSIYCSDSTQRITGEYVNVGKERGTFAVASRSFAQQFSQIYFVRLAALAPLLRAQAEAKWSGGTV